jgi:hypothetical protein
MNKSKVDISIYSFFEIKDMHCECKVFTPTSDHNSIICHFILYESNARAYACKQ